MKILFAHAHFDDFEFTAAGIFELWRRRDRDQVRRRVLVCTDGKAGHQFRTRNETGTMRLVEQQKSADIGGYEFEMLKLPNGEVPREACLLVTTDLLAGLWNGIRDFEPDYLFCPSIPSDPLAGVHVDHCSIAEAIRKVAYMINVPHAFTPEYPTDETVPQQCTVPVILNVYDPYTGATHGYDLAVCVEDAFDRIAAMSWCHQSQISEWLPWVGRHSMRAPDSVEDWKQVLRARYERQNRQLGIDSSDAYEFFNVTGWGRVPDFDNIISDIPGIDLRHSNFERLKRQLAAMRID